MSVVSRLANSVFTSLAGYVGAEEQHPRELYKLQRYYYENNALYDRLHAALYSVGADTQSLRPIRNPANRAVEFYAAKLWPGDLAEAFEIKAEQEAIVEPIQQVWKWSNWAANKQVAARWFALDGDLLIKVVQNTDMDQVYLQLIEAQYLSDFDTDHRDYLTYIRLDLPQVRRQGDELKPYTLTEVWDKRLQTYRTWQHTKPADTPLEQLGTPTREEEMSAFGIDFLPFVHAKFRDIGEKRGVGCFTHAIDKIDEANRIATRLHQMLYRHNSNTWAVTADAFDKSGRPIPPPTVSTTSRATPGRDSAGNVLNEDQAEALGEKIVGLPSGWQLQSLVPQLQYAAALSILQDHMTEIEQDLPELAWYRLRQMGRDLSGRAVRLLLGDAVAKASEARGNAVAALVRANQMALTIGQNAGLFDGLGTYESGALEHTIKLPEILPLNEIEELEKLQVKGNLGVPQEQLWDEMGYSEEEIAKMRGMAEAGASIGERMLRNFETQFGGGGFGERE